MMAVALSQPGFMAAQTPGLIVVRLVLRATTVATRTGDADTPVIDGGGLKGYN